MVVLTAETCWALNGYWIYNKISGIKLVSLYSTIKMMHGPINIRFIMSVRQSVRIEKAGYHGMDFHQISYWRILFRKPIGKIHVGLHSEKNGGYIYIYIICINNCPTRCNKKQSIYYSASSLYMFRVLEGGSCTKNMTGTGGCSYSFVYSWWWVWLTPETSRVNLQNNK